MRLTHLYINIICEAHSHLHTTSVTSVRLTHTWVITASQRLGAGSGIRGWVRVRANVYICGDVKDGSLTVTCMLAIG